ncbi:MAG TPA: indolepyruvate ferredoxin oxidoreductase family protein, partial [Hellea balneolensis]|nr:indolepyruvate ferredoxin oxidoreductase family protein [Hellea balneolensis]
TGTQALVRIALDQRLRDKERGLNTAGFISGYRGSPLGAYDLELWKAADKLKQANIEFLPAVNEDLAATAILGSQQVETDPDKTVDGVFGIWYGKGPGIDRAGDALKHGNAYGSSPHGGVLVVAGDDHGCVSSSMGHQSDVAFMTFFMPVLNPANVAEYLEFGEYGFALSRYSGMWVGFKAVSETVESAASIEIPKPRRFQTPDFKIPATGLHYRWPDLPGPQIEQRLAAKKRAALAFAQANPIDKTLWGHQASFGIVTTGKGHLDTLEALRLLGLDQHACQQLGIDIYKVGMVWPLEGRRALRFSQGKRELFIVEEKRGIIESQFKEYFYDQPGGKPKLMVGKYDADGSALLPWTGELTPIGVAQALAKRLDQNFAGHNFTKRAQALRHRLEPAEFETKRTAYFCSGCPHNRSTKLPEGSQALAGIGCHFMASWMDRNTTSLIQMGGEGVNWIARSRFNGAKHIFQNLGEGTFYHSGSMAIRQAKAAGINITYKILYNDAVAMTGGQPVDGPVSVHAIAQNVASEGVEKIVLVSDHPEKFAAADFPPGTSICHRDELDKVQRQLREHPGVSVLIYEQVCATENRKQRKRGLSPDPAKFVMINELVCEGCGDCSEASNCLSIEPVETEFGRKRRVNQNSCNKDFSCVDGFCPSFVTIEGGRRKTPSQAQSLDIGPLPLPKITNLTAPFDLLVTGVGGTGVVTIGALITMAAHLDGKGASVLDFTGFAQKFGPVLSYIRLGKTPDDLHQVRIDTGRADALLGCDLVVSTSEQAIKTYCKDHTQAVVSTSEMPTGEITRNPDLSLQSGARLKLLQNQLGPQNLAMLDAISVCEALLGNSVYANVMLMGMGWQNGLVPVSLEAIENAIRLNGVAIQNNLYAFALGRLAAHDKERLQSFLPSKTSPAETLDNIIHIRSQFLKTYQNQKYADQYQHRLQALIKAEASLDKNMPVSKRAAKALFKLMAYKDEYEVARLHTDKSFTDQIKTQFEGDYKIISHLAPPLVSVATDGRGYPKKTSFGPWIRKVYPLLARLKFLRGRWLDPFGHTTERKTERAMIRWCETLIDYMAQNLDQVTSDDYCKAMELVLKIRGYGHIKDKAYVRLKPKIDALIYGRLQP